MTITKKKIIWLFAAVIFAVALACGLLYLNRVKKYKDAVNSLTYEALALDRIADGVYTGECDADFIYAKVEVTVKDGQIQSLVLAEHKNDRGAAAEAIVSKIVEAQSLHVDAVSGATNSSKVIKKAVENALSPQQ